MGPSPGVFSSSPLPFVRLYLLQLLALARLSSSLTYLLLQRAQELWERIQRER